MKQMKQALAFSKKKKKKKKKKLNEGKHYEYTTELLEQYYLYSAYEINKCMRYMRITSFCQIKSKCVHGIVFERIGKRKKNVALKCVIFVF